MTFTLDPNCLEDVIKTVVCRSSSFGVGRLKAIIPVHLYGQTAAMDPIIAIAEKYNLTIIEDAAQSFGAEYKGKKAGAIGDLGCFSFFPSKNLSGYGDGGMIVTDDDELAETIRMLRVHGCKTKYFHPIIGYNSRLDSLQAAVVNTKLPYLEKWLHARRENAFACSAMNSRSATLPSSISNFRRPAFKFRTIACRGSVSWGC